MVRTTRTASRNAARTNTVRAARASARPFVYSQTAQLADIEAWGHMPGAVAIAEALDAFARHGLTPAQCHALLALAAARLDAPRARAIPRARIEARLARLARAI